MTIITTTRHLTERVRKLPFLNISALSKLAGASVNVCVFASNIFPPLKPWRNLNVMRSSWQCQCASSTPAPPAPPGELRDKLLPHSNLRGHRGLSAVCCLLSPLQLSHISHSSPARNYTLVPFTSDSSIVVIILQPATNAGIIFDSFHIKSPS